MRHNNGSNGGGGNYDEPPEGGMQNNSKANRKTTRQQILKEQEGGGAGGYGSDGSVETLSVNSAQSMQNRSNWTFRKLNYLKYPLGHYSDNNKSNEFETNNKCKLAIKVRMKKWTQGANWLWRMRRK